MSDGSVRNQIRQFVTTNFYLPDPDKVADTTSFLESGIVDSTGVLDIVTFIEKEFGIRVEDEELLPENLDSVASLVAFVDRKRAG